jgi:hypothetical protein
LYKEIAMMSGKARKLIILTIVSSVAVSAGSLFEGLLSHAGSGLSAADSAQSSRKSMEGKDESASEMVRNLEALLVDLAEYNICSSLGGQYIPLSSGGSGSGSGTITNTGIIRIDTCSTGEVDHQHLRIELAGTGWQWISRKKEQLGATFTVNENVKFDVKISMVGAFDVAYDKADHIVDIWFVPTQPVVANLRVIGNVDVDTESLWSSIVGIAGTLGGETSGQRAEATINKQGNRMFQSKLSKGMTVIMDLCTGRYYFKLGSFPAGQLPESAGKGRKYLVNSKGILHEGGMLMAGPFDTEKPIIARIDATEGGINASLVCEDNARKIEDAYVNGKELPKPEPLAEGIVQPGRPVTFKVKADPGCKAVLIMRPLEGQKGSSAFDYAAYHEGEKPKPLVDCAR